MKQVDAMMRAGVRMHFRAGIRGGTLDDVRWRRLARGWQECGCSGVEGLEESLLVVRVWRGGYVMSEVVGRALRLANSHLEELSMQMIPYHRMEPQAATRYVLAKPRKPQHQA